MNINIETIEKLVSNKFEIDCIDICLTQKTDNEPIIYTGPGTIYQDNRGILQLKLYSKISDIRKEISFNLKYHAPGKIIAKDNYFTLNATDMTGMEWIADNVWVYSDVSLPTNGQIIKSTLGNIETNKNGLNNEKCSFIIIVPGKYEIPCNEKEDLPGGGWRLNKSVFSVNNINYEFKYADNYLSISAVSEDNHLNIDTHIRLREALSIIMGLFIQPIIVKHTQHDRSVLKIISKSDSYANKKLPPPFKHSTPDDMKAFSCFIGKYMANIDASFSDLFGFWHKISSAWQADIGNSSLSLAVAIEGITRSYFAKHGLPDDEIIQQADEAKQILNDINLGDRIKKRLLSSIGNLSNTSPKIALNKMVNNGILSKTMADKWERLRNKSVHPDILNEPSKVFQEHIDEIYICIALFYRLLFMIIEYEGSYINYSKNGWPEKIFQSTYDSHFKR